MNKAEWTGFLEKITPNATLKITAALIKKTTVSITVPLLEFQCHFDLSQLYEYHSPCHLTNPVDLHKHFRNVLLKIQDFRSDFPLLVRKYNLQAKILILQVGYGLPPQMEMLLMKVKSLVQVTWAMEFVKLR